MKYILRWLMISSSSCTLWTQWYCWSLRICPLYSKETPLHLENRFYSISKSQSWFRFQCSMKYSWHWWMFQPIRYGIVNLGLSILSMRMNSCKSIMIKSLKLKIEFFIWQYQNLNTLTIQVKCLSLISSWSDFLNNFDHISNQTQ